jgi:2-(1,2-epoxy-1,2-dihydrophenyl)acetyl-CoA isomerase
VGASTSYEQLVVERDGAVAVVRLNNPSKLNALSDTMTAELNAALEELAGDPGVRALVLTGEGRGFCSGADLGDIDRAGTGGGAAPSELLENGYAKAARLLATAPKPVIASVNGVAAGAGMALALACDLRVASGDAWFTMGFVRIGLVPDSGAAHFLPRIVGAARALELSITGDRVDAETALRIGLVTRVVPGDRLRDETLELATRLAAMPTTAIALTKTLLRDASALSLEDTLALEGRVQDEAALTADHREGVDAFLQKREPRFEGR